MQSNPLTPRTYIPSPPARQPAIGADAPSNGPNEDSPHPSGPFLCGRPASLSLYSWDS